MSHWMVGAKDNTLKPGNRVCMRCDGRREMYSVCGGWSHVDTGGVLKPCPLCLGEGQIKKLDNLDEQIKEILTKPALKRRRKSTSIDINSNSVSQDING